MFTGTGPDYLVVKESDGGITETFQDTEFTSLILPITEQPSDIYERLDAYVSREVVDYTGAKGTKADARSVLWFKTLPSLLLLQESVC